MWLMERLRHVFHLNEPNAVKRMREHGREAEQALTSALARLDVLSRLVESMHDDEIKRKPNGQADDV